MNSIIVKTTTQKVSVSSPSQGPPGPPGIPAIGGKDIIINNLKPKNLLTYSLSQDAWVNIEQEAVTDGGNF